VNQLYAIAAAVSLELGDFHFGLSATFAAFAKAAAPVAVAALWQGAAVAIGMALFLSFAPRVSAAHRFTAWAIGFAVVACLPFMPLFSPVAANSGPVSAAPFAAPPRAWLELDSRWGLMIASIWLLASMIRLAELTFHTTRLRKLWKSATPIEGSDLANCLAPALQAGRKIQVCTTRELNRPSVIGFFAPRILVPEWLFERLTPQELEQVVLHEAEHLRRRDDWTNLLQKLCLVLFPLSPALVWMERRLCREREMACDEGVVRMTQAPRAYAACLTSLAERGLQRDLERRAEALSLAAWRRRPELVHRVHSILRGKQALHPITGRVLLGVAGCGLLLGSVELASCPQMVAFVASPKSVTVAKLEPGPITAANAPAIAPGFRAIPAKAILPSSALAPAASGDAPRYDGARRSEPPLKNEVAAGPRKQLIRATMPSASVARVDRHTDQNSGEEYIVFTAWEQVQAAPLRSRDTGSREMADYDTGEAALPPSQPGGQPNANSPTQIRVTRLILRIDPSGPAAGSKTTNDSQSDQPVAVPLDGGWLVFQL
jgi:beta-lactamase regulating signal transducer with metallopeptidase domain